MTGGRTKPRSMSPDAIASTWSAVTSSRSTRSTCGSSSAIRRRNDRTYPWTDTAVKPTARVPPAPVGMRRTASELSSASRRMRLASARNTRPAGVTLTVRPVRSSKVTPTSCSSSLI